MISQEEVARLCGWRPDFPKIKEMVGQLPHRTFQSAAPHLMQASDRFDGNALLWEDAIAVLGHHVPAKRQSIGDCTAMGWTNLLNYLQCSDVHSRGVLADVKLISHSVMYGLGREAAGMLGRGDGCYGAAMAKAASTAGSCSNAEANDSDTSDDLAAKYGRDGVPADLKKVALPHLLREVTPVTSSAAAKAALVGRYPVAVCSSQGFTMTRDQDGFCYARGSWAHCMTLIGYRSDRDAFAVLQSWGDNVPDGPTTLGQPDCSFWVDSRTIDGMLAEGDSFTGSAFAGYPAPSPVPPAPPTPPVPPGPVFDLIVEMQNRMGMKTRYGCTLLSGPPRLDGAETGFESRIPWPLLLDYLRRYGPYALAVLLKLLGIGPLPPVQAASVERANQE